MSDLPSPVQPPAVAGPIQQLRTLVMSSAVFSVRLSGHGARDGGAQLMMQDSFLEYQPEGRCGSVRALELTADDVQAMHAVLNASFPPAIADPPPDPRAIELSLPMIQAAMQLIGERTGAWLNTPTIAAALRAAFNAMALPPDRSDPPVV